MTTLGLVLYIFKTLSMSLEAFVTLRSTYHPCPIPSFLISTTTTISNTTTDLLLLLLLLVMQVLEIRAGTCESNAHMLFYRVRFDRWPQSYDKWVEESALCLPRGSASGGHTKALRTQARESFVEQHVSQPPEVLQSLNAYQYLGLADRACFIEENAFRPPLTFSDCNTLLGTNSHRLIPRFKRY